MKKDLSRLNTINDEYLRKNEYLEHESRLIRDDYKFVLEKNKNLINRLDKFNFEFEEKNKAIELEYLNATKMFQDKILLLNQK